MLKSSNTKNEKNIKVYIMNRQQLIDEIRRKKSFLCVGLDPDTAKMPAHLNGDLFAFNKEIVDATAQYAVAYKPNLAFYEALGTRGYTMFEQTVKYIQEKYPELFIIADAKRGDIGNTSRMYAHSFFEEMNIDAVTVAPYMGEDSVTPFLGFDGKWVILLGLTSNKGSHDFQLTTDANGTPLFETVMRRSSAWGNKGNMMYVVGATQGRMFEDVRRILPEHFLLVPGVGAQGGSLAEVAKYGMTDECGLLVNSSRGIIHASNGQDFAAVAAEKAKELQQEMEKLLADKGVI